MAQHEKRNYLLRDIPEEIWTPAKHLAIDKGISFRELILLSIKVYLDINKTKE